MNIDAVADRLYVTLIAGRPTVRRMDKETVKAILVEEITKRADRLEKNPTDVMSATLVAALRRTAKAG